jgi:tetratricopeptide (TPR) repeat protein/S1-C subfamily serine protease
MKSYGLDRHTRWLGASLMAAFLLSASLAGGQIAVPSKKDGEPSPPSKKTGDEEPPLPSKKPAPAKQVRVEVTARSAEVQAGDNVVATVSRGQVLPFTKKTDEYYLVIVDGKKGWIQREAVREVEVAIGGKDAPTIEVPPGPAPAVIDRDTTRKVKQATVLLRVRLANDDTLEGSGFFAVEPGLVLTNAHVLGMLRPGSPTPEKVQVVVHSGETEEFILPAQVLGVDRQSDLGVLRVKGGAGRLPAPLPVDTSRSLALVQKVYIFGFPFGTSLGKDITASESSVSSIRKDEAGVATEVQVNGGMHRGNSGGPVVDSRGMVVGVAVSAIRGTQLHFAVPGERVQDLLRGRVAQTQLGEPFLDKDQAKLPVRVSCLDPLQRIRTVKLEVWAGKAAPGRPPSLTEPQPLPDDGPKNSLTTTYEDNMARADVPIPSLAAGQVLWIRPVLADANKATHWGGAVAYSPSGLPPLERKAAVLRIQFDHHAQRTLKLTRSVRAQVSKGARRTLFRDFMEAEIVETAKEEPRGGRLDLALGACKFTTTDMRDKDHALSPRAQPFLRNRTMTFIVDPQGALLQRTIPALPPPAPIDLREDFADLVHFIANSYEMTCLAMPNRRVKAQETWQARVPLILVYPDDKQIVDLFLTCTYEGSRLYRGQACAVIILSGTVKGRKPGQQSTAGIVTGKVYFAIDDGYLSLADIKVESDGGSDDLMVAHSLEVTLTRNPGNKTGIVARGAAPAPGAPAAAGGDYERAIPHIQRRDFDQAIPLLEKAIAANPNFMKAHSELGFAYVEKQLYDQAIPHLRKAIELDPKQATAHNNLGAAFNGKGLYDEAISCYQKAIELEPKYAAAHANLGVAYNAKRLYGQAIPCFEKALELDPHNVAVLSNLGFAYNSKQLYDKAISSLKKVIELDPNHVTALNNLGAAFNSKGLYDEAIPCFKKAIKLQPKHAIAHGNLGFAYKARGLNDEAIPGFKKAIELQPKQAVAHDSLGTVLGELGDLQQARDAFQKALELTPEAAPAFKSRKQILEQMEALLRLEPRLTDIVKGELKAKNFEEGLQLGKLCRVKQHYGAALRLYEQALSSDPEAAKKLAPINLVILARVALLAAAGEGNDPPPVEDRAKYRAKALAWLQSFVKAQQRALEKEVNTNRYLCQSNLRLLAQHKDLTSVRPPALNSLPAEERKAWGSFWSKVDALLEKADAPSLDPSPGANP